MQSCGYSLFEAQKLRICLTGGRKVKNMPYTIRKINLKRDVNENHGNLKAKNTLGLMGSRPNIAWNFGSGPFFELSFRMVPNALAQSNFQAL